MPTYGMLSLFPVEMLSSPHQEPTSSISSFNITHSTSHYDVNVTEKLNKMGEVGNKKSNTATENTNNGATHEANSARGCKR